MKIWFMFDNHTFKRIDLKGDLVEQVFLLFERDPYGTVFVRDEHDSEIKSLTRDGDGKPTIEDIEEWASAVRCELDFRHRMNA